MRTHAPVRFPSAQGQNRPLEQRTSIGRAETFKKIPLASITCPEKPRNFCSGPIANVCLAQEPSAIHTASEALTSAGPHGRRWASRSKRECPFCAQYRRARSRSAFRWRFMSPGMAMWNGCHANLRWSRSGAPPRPSSTTSVDDHWRGHLRRFSRNCDQAGSLPRIARASC